MLVLPTYVPSRETRRTLPNLPYARRAYHIRREGGGGVAGQARRRTHSTTDVCILAYCHVVSACSWPTSGCCSLPGNDTDVRHPRGRTYGLVIDDRSYIHRYIRFRPETSSAQRLISPFFGWHRVGLRRSASEPPLRPGAEPAVWRL